VRIFSIVVFITLWFSAILGQNTGISIYQTQSGYVSFVSEAPLELISAESKELKGIVDPVARTFAFQLEIKSLKGFNSPLQQEHFYENYMETEKYPTATFTGKIIEDVDFENPGEVKIRAKGELTIHGIKKERIIQCTLNIREDGFTAQSRFTVLLEDHNISIPKLVYQKIAEEIKVEISAEFKKAEKNI
jgi:hypothetical protein